MKKICLVLLLAALGRDLSAQIRQYPNPSPASESIFGNPPMVEPSLRSRFDFILPLNNRMIIDLNTISAINHIPDLDSLFKKIWADLEPLRDSLADPLMIRRVDYVATGPDIKIRIKEYKSTGTYFGYKDDELVQLKVDQDTLQYKGLVGLPGTMLYQGRAIPRTAVYSVILLLNNISDVAGLRPDLLNSSLALLKKDFEPDLKRKKVNWSLYYALYDVQKQKRISPLSFSGHGFETSHGILPHIQMGAQYVRGAWSPSVGAGFSYYYGKNVYGQYNVQLMTETYFFFQRDDKNNLLTQKNQFITARFHSDYKTRDPASNRLIVEFNLNYSLGYLIHREGEWFKKHTFKFALPGLHSKNVLLEPEFFFNNLFKNGSPSLKLTMFIP